MGLIKVQWGGADWIACNWEQTTVAVSCEHDNAELQNSSESTQFIDCFYENFKGGPSL